MKLDHIAYRVSDREATAEFICNEFGYCVADEFNLKFADGSTTKSYALKKDGEPEIFVSEGEIGSVVDRWVKDKGGKGGIHHVAYRVDDVSSKMKDWLDRNIAEFTTDEPIIGERLIQAFTKEHPLTGVIIELIQRDGEGVGFEPENVKRLMESTKG